MSATERWKQRQSAPQEMKVTLVTRGVTVGNEYLKRFLEKDWKDVQQALYYICVVAPKVFPKSVGDRVLVLIETYIRESTDGAGHLRDEALKKMQEADIDPGESGSKKLVELQMFHPLQRQITNMCAYLDEYAAVTETMWIDEVMSQKEHEGCDAKIRGTCADMRRLCNSMSDKLRQFVRDRKEAPDNKSGKPADEVCSELEEWFFEKTGIDLRVTREVKQKPQQEAAATEVSEEGAGTVDTAATTQGTRAETEGTKETKQEQEAEAAVAA